ncbi:MAG: PAS domain-containing protein [Nevskia sp.]|nr:PAS domain-containing protein [Nevskia sp.]
MLFIPAEQGLAGLESVIGALAEAVVVADSDGTIILANPVAERLFGYPRLAGKPVEALIPGHLADAHRVYRKLYLNQPERRPMAKHSHLWARRADGEDFCVRIGLIPFWTDRGVWTAAVVTETETPRDS